MGVIASNYIAHEAQDPADLFIPFIHFLWQRASWSHTVGRLKKVEDDIQNLGTSFAKIEHFHRMRDAIGSGVVLFVATKLEYLFVLARSLIDLCYDLFRDLWNRNVKLIDGDALRDPQPLPSKLSRPVFQESPGQPVALRPIDELVAKNGLPYSFAAACLDVGRFLLPLREARDAITHHGERPPHIYATDRGFCVNRTEFPFSLFAVWNDQEHRYNDNLVSLMPLVAHLVFNAVNVGNVFMEGITQQIEFQPEIAPGYKVFSRGYHNSSLAKAMRIATGGSPWPESGIE